MVILWSRRFIESVCRSFLYCLEQVADFALVGRDHAFQDGAAGAGSAGDEDLLENCGSGSDYVRLFGKAFE